MADNQITHLPEEPTRQDFPETRDKVVDTVELTAESDFYGITIRFQDKTALTFSLEPCLIAFPVYSDWEGGEETVLKKYQPILSKVYRA
jgi:hypothetical protein